MKQRLATRHAFTAWDLVVLMGAVALLVFLLLPAMNMRRGPACRTNHCVSNIKEIGLAFRLWSMDHDEKFPMSVTAVGDHGGTREFNLTGQVWRHFQTLTQELPNPKVLTCPADSRQRRRDWKDLHDNRSLSYFVGLDADETKPQTILSGDRNLTSALPATNGVLTWSAGDRMEWTAAMHNRAGHIGLADGGALRVTDHCLTKQLQSAIATTGQKSQRLALPE